ncbi:Uncharacterised protein [Vibrio cholerae]|nr:Uncharacterised protein [Vibrio cholerae]
MKLLFQQSHVQTHLYRFLRVFPYSNTANEDLAR